MFVYYQNSGNYQNGIRLCVDAVLQWNPIHIVKKSRISIGKCMRFILTQTPIGLKVAVWQNRKIINPQLNYQFIDKRLTGILNRDKSGIDIAHRTLIVFVSARKFPFQFIVCMELGSICMSLYLS